MRRVVHLRLKANAAYGCFEIQRKRGLHPEHKRLSTVVSEVLESVISTMRSKGELDEISDADADHELTKILAQTAGPSEQDMGLGLAEIEFGQREPEDEEEPVEDSEPDLEPYSVDLNEEETDEPPLSQEELEARGREVVGATQRYLESEDREIFKEGEDEQDDEQPMPLAERPPWEEEGVLPIEELGKEVGRDEIYDSIMSNPEPDEGYRRALQVVYSKIPRELWGTDRARELIESLLPVVRQHLKNGQTQDDNA